MIGLTKEHVFEFANRSISVDSVKLVATVCMGP